ncbi:hypothetical protein AEMCBJ_00710 [Cupriavidus necator]
MINERVATRVVTGYYIIPFPSRALPRPRAAAANPCLASVCRIDLYPEIEYLNHASITLAINSMQIQHYEFI